MESPTPASHPTPRTASIVLGVVGGALDLAVGLLILATGPMASSNGMGVTGAYIGSILLLLLGGLILGAVEGVGTLFFSSAAVNMLGFLMVIAILVLRPRGLVGGA